MKKNKKEQVYKLSFPDRKTIFSSFLILLGVYLISYFVVNSYAKSNGLPKVSIVNPQGWFKSIPTLTPTPTITSMISNPFGLNQDTLVFCIGLGDESQNSMTLKECEDYYKLAGQPVDYMVNCEQKAECGGKSTFKKLSECKNTVCCQINDNYWKEYPSIEECEKAKLIIAKTETTEVGQPLPVLHGDVIFGLINQYRSSKGLPFLSVSDELCRLAEGRADLMMANDMEAFKRSGTGSHYGFDSTNYSGEGVGENLAANVGLDADVLTIWKNSPPHNELLLWTVKDGTPITKGCVATRVSKVGSIVVLLVGDK